MDNYNPNTSDPQSEQITKASSQPLEQSFQNPQLTFKQVNSTHNPNNYMNQQANNTSPFSQRDTQSMKKTDQLRINSQTPIHYHESTKHPQFVSPANSHPIILSSGGNYQMLNSLYQQQQQSHQDLKQLEGSSKRRKEDNTRTTSNNLQDRERGRELIRQYQNSPRSNSEKSFSSKQDFYSQKGGSITPYGQLVNTYGHNQQQPGTINNNTFMPPFGRSNTTTYKNFNRRDTSELDLSQIGESNAIPQQIKAMEMEKVNTTESMYGLPQDGLFRQIRMFPGLMNHQLQNGNPQHSMYSEPMGELMANQQQIPDPEGKNANYPSQSNQNYHKSIFAHFNQQNQQYTGQSTQNQNFDNSSFGVTPNFNNNQQQSNNPNLMMSQYGVQFNLDSQPYYSHEQNTIVQLSQQNSMLKSYNDYLKKEQLESQKVIESLKSSNQYKIQSLKDKLNEQVQRNNNLKTKVEKIKNYLQVLCTMIEENQDDQEGDGSNLSKLRENNQFFRRKTDEENEINLLEQLCQGIKKLLKEQNQHKPKKFKSRAKSQIGNSENSICDCGNDVSDGVSQNRAKSLPAKLVRNSSIKSRRSKKSANNLLNLHKSQNGENVGTSKSQGHRSKSGKHKDPIEFQSQNGFTAGNDESIDDNADEMEQYGKKQKYSVEKPTKWVPNDAQEECYICKCYFNVFKRKHHCRNCGQLVCYYCSNHFEYAAGYGDQKVRMCDACYRDKKKLNRIRQKKWSFISGHFQPQY